MMIITSTKSYILVRVRAERRSRDIPIYSYLFLAYDYGILILILTYTCTYTYTTKLYLLILILNTQCKTHDARTRNAERLEIIACRSIIGTHSFLHSSSSPHATSGGIDLSSHLSIYPIRIR